MFRTVIVEDELPVLNLMRLMLQKNGAFDIAGSFRDPLEALRQIDSLQPHIIFLDIEMPKMNGIELEFQLQRQQQKAEIVFVTAFRQYDVQTMEVRPLDYMMKPITLKAIQSVQRLLSGQQHK